MLLPLIAANRIRELVRNSRFDANLFLRIMLLLSLIYFLMLAWYIGSNFENFINEYRPAADPVSRFNYFLIFLLLGDFTIRLLRRGHPFRHTKCFLHLPIRKGSLILHELAIRVFCINNIFFILIAVSFAFQSLLPVAGMSHALLFLTAMFLLLMFSGFLALLTKNLTGNSVLFWLIPAGCVILMLLLRPVFKLYPSSAFMKLLNPSDANFGWIIGTLAVADLLLLFLNRSAMKQLVYRMYESPGRSLPFFSGRSEKYLPQIHEEPYDMIEMRLVLRNRRLRQILLLPLLIVLLSAYLFIKEEISNVYILLSWLMASCGILGYSLNQYMFSWEGGFFDFLSCTAFRMERYLRSKHRIFVLTNLIILMLLLPVTLTAHIDMHILLTAFLFNCGIGYFITCFTATWNDRKMDLDIGMLFNLQGSSGFNGIAIFFVIIMPLLLMFVLNAFLSQGASLLFLDMLSILSFLNHRKWYTLILKQLKKRKYINLEGFRR